MSAPCLSQRFTEAFAFAHCLHHNQTRKGSAVPYMSHLMAVAALTLEFGGNEDQAIAALLHDGPEDQGGEAVLTDIRQRFGDQVADLVHACTEPLDIARSDWWSRKRAYLAHLQTIPAPAALIAGCDKVHNASNLLRDLHAHGATVFARFNGGEDGTRWWYRSLAEQLGPRLPSGLQRELTRLAQEIGAFI